MSESKVHRTDYRSDSNLDGLLKSFFESEMANPWPNWKTPKQQSVTLADNPQSPSRSFRSYFALAASIALMIFGFMFVSDKLQTGDAFRGNYDRIGIKPTYDDPQIKKERIKISEKGPSQYQFDVESRP